MIVRPVAADAVADSGTFFPETVAPGAGAVIATVGLLFTVKPTGADVVLLLAESVAIAVTVCGPLASLVVSSAML